MLPISFIPMDAIHHLYEIFDFVMKARFPKLISLLSFETFDVWVMHTQLKGLSSVLSSG